jgi:prolyl-tRNA synthetase
MLLALSTLFLRTLREDPADAEVPSHRLLVRAGYIRRVGPGGYAWLPLGRLVLDRITAVVRAEMLAIGAQEVSFPALVPATHYRTSGRWTAYGAEIFRLRDRREVDHLLAPTHEELFTVLVRDLYASYRDYPVTLFQIQTKFRDEPRPRAGLLRTREFLMKDSYSFDLDEAGRAAAYTRHREAYRRVFERLGLDYRIVAASGGAMGGSSSEEFHADAPTGEDTYVACGSCSYAANTEAVAAAPPPVAHREWPAAEVVDTPDTPTIGALVALLNSTGRRVSAADTLKNVVVQVRTPGVAEAELLVLGVPGDREADLSRVAAALYPAEVTMVDDFAAQPALVRGYVGPQILRSLGIRYLVDPRVAPGTAWITGANAPGRHAVNVVCGRDFTPDGVLGIADVRDGDPCPVCGAALTIRRGIEIGHIFALGRRFSDVFGLTALGPDGGPVPVTMGSYGIGVSRLVAAVAEQRHDERGLCWPAAVAPCDVHVVPAGRGDQLELARSLATSLVERGLRVLLDDRPGLSAGVRFADAELIGIPRIVVVGRRAAEGYVELRDRATGDRADVALADVASHLDRDPAEATAADAPGGRRPVAGTPPP